jgi:cytochrome P450
MRERNANVNSDHFVTGFDECRFILSHAESFAVERTCYPGAEEIRGRRGVQLIDGEQHRKLHAFLTTYFSSHADHLRANVVRPLITQAIQVISQSVVEIEAFAHFTAPLSLRIISAVLGLPTDDADIVIALAEWRDSLTPWVATQGETAAERETAVKAAARVRDLILPTIRERKNGSQDQLLSALWSIGPSIYGDWDENDVLDQCRIMLLAGSEGVARLTSTAIHLALDDPVIRRTVASEDGRFASAFVDCAARYYPPAQLRPRIARRSANLGGRNVSPGDRICLNVVEANRDRAAAKRHLAFNIGERYCSGAPLACAEAEEIVSNFFRAFPECARVEAAQAARFEGLLFLGFSPVHVRLNKSATQS